MDKALLGQTGSQLQAILYTFDGAVYNPEAVRLKEYERMLDTDETVGTAFDFLSLSILSLMGTYHHPDDKVTTFVHECLEGMQDSLPIAAMDILSALWAGFSATEIVWKPDGKQIKLDYLATYHPSTITFVLDSRGRLDGVKQRWLFSALDTNIPVEKCLIYTHNKRFNNYYGISAFKRIRKNWLLKDAFLKMWAKALDKYGTPLTTAIVPDGNVVDPETGEEVSQLEYATKLLANLQSGTALALSAKGDGKDSRLPEVKATFPGSGVGDSFNQAVSYLNKMICRGMLIPSLVFDEGSRSGSYALGESHFDSFMLTIRSIYVQLTDILLDQLIRRLVEYNFGPQDEYGTFQEKPPGEDQIKVLSEAFLALTTGGYLDPAIQEDLNYVRVATGLPEREVAAKETVKKSYSRYLRGNDDEQ